MSRRNNEIGVILAGAMLIIIINCFLTRLLGVFIGTTIEQYFSSKAHKNYSYFRSFVIGFSSVGIYQLFYVIPLTLILKGKREFGWMRGVILGAVITTLLTGFCFLQVGI